jgi:hypothetical protein
MNSQSITDYYYNIVVPATEKLPTNRNREYLPPPAFLSEYATWGLNVPRQCGKTTALLEIFTKVDAAILLTQTHRDVDSVCRELHRPRNAEQDIIKPVISSSTLVSEHSLDRVFRGRSDLPQYQVLLVDEVNIFESNPLRSILDNLFILIHTLAVRQALAPTFHIFFARTGR